MPTTNHSDVSDLLILLHQPLFLKHVAKVKLTISVLRLFFTTHCWKLRQASLRYGYLENTLKFNKYQRSRKSTILIMKAVESHFQRWFLTPWLLHCPVPMVGSYCSIAWWCATLKTSIMSNGSYGHKNRKMKPMAHSICPEIPRLKRHILWTCEEALIEILKYQLFLQITLLYTSPGRWS